jgi:hypothetical protein
LGFQLQRMIIGLKAKSETVLKAPSECSILLIILVISLIVIQFSFEESKSVQSKATKQLILSKGN